MSIFNYTNKELESLKATFTATEIHQQPSTWEKIIEQVRSRAEEIKAFINKVIHQEDYDVILTGAGTSEFVGNALYSYLNRKLITR